MADQDPAAFASAGRSLRRVHSITGLKENKAAYYIELHAVVWPEILRLIKRCHIQNYSIALKEIDGKLFLFSYFEYTGENFDADMKTMAENSEMHRWWKETDPCQIPLPDAAAVGKIWSYAQEVFYST